ncbi:RNA-directed DNA polymerase from mobile element jockey-like [Elysia marginata]|uniref:RNA-directed DNA polymerase from mobile element jockey-like n=1 Tax=Elysia marginata TaxID=1093978 RepID=A0AAV4JL16_9GAST|nr:RNA-directed DNA polymerase from mobile element jockey-like [Elysia marginata]
MEKDKILERWAEYIHELFDDNRKHDHNVMKRNFAGPPIMKDEVRAAIRKMIADKATGPDGVAVEMIEALEEYGVEKLTSLLNEIYDTGEIPLDISRSVFIALPKKPGATECELHPTISLMSHVTKILLRVVMRIRSKIKPGIADEQYGCVEGKGTTNAIHTLRTLIQRAIEVQKDVYLCLIDYTKAFDRVRHDEIMKDLTQIKIDGKDLRVIKNIYWEKTAAMRVEGETSTYQKIRGVQQGSLPTLEFLGKLKRSLTEDRHSHGDVDSKTTQEGQGASWLGHCIQVDQSVDKASHRKDSEVEECSPQRRATCNIEQAEQHKRDDILQIILMTSGTQGKMSNL